MIPRKASVVLGHPIKTKTASISAIIPEVNNKAQLTAGRNLMARKISVIPSITKKMAKIVARAIAPAIGFNNMTVPRTIAAALDNKDHQWLCDLMVAIP